LWLIVNLIEFYLVFIKNSIYLYGTRLLYHLSRTSQTHTTMITRILFIGLILIGLVRLGQAQQVSKGLHQILTSDESEPTSIYIKIGTPNVEVKKTAGTRIRVSGKVKISIPNLYFLEHLVKQGRYTLNLTPSGDGGLRMEDKSKTPIILRGQECREDIYFTIYVPTSIKTVVVENTLTGDSNVVTVN